MGDVTIPFAVLAGLGLALTAIGGVLTAAIAALWVENKALTKRILEREDARTAKRAAAIEARETRRAIEANDTGIVSVRPLAFDDDSAVIDTERLADQEWYAMRRATREAPTIDDRAGLTPRQERRIERYSRGEDPSTPPEPLPPRGKMPSRSGPR